MNLLLLLGLLLARDWAKYPAIVEVNPPGDIVAVGDIHGDYDRFTRLLRAAGVIEGDAWKAGNTTLVVTGDMIDKGPEPVAVLRFLAALQKSAARSGGRVIVLQGNHEAEFLAGPDAKKAKDMLDDLAHHNIAPTQVTACAGDIGEFLCSLPLGARVGDWFFSHGGNTAGSTIAQLEAKLPAGQLAEDSMLEARLGEGKKWFAAPDEKALLSGYAGALGVKHMVQGHQPKQVKFADGVQREPGEIFQRWGLLFLIDVGMSRGVGDSQGAALRITHDGASAVCPDGRVTPLWNAKLQQDSARTICQ